MTCIVGIVDQENNRVVMGADSAGVSGLDITIRKDPKIFKVGEFVIGCTSSFRMIQLIRFSFSIPNSKPSHLPKDTNALVGKDIHRYMCTDFVDALRKTLSKGGFLQKDKEEESAGTFLVAYKDRLFQIQDDLQVSESVKDYDACGCGKYYALGSLWTNNNLNVTIENRLRLALECAEEFSGGVRGPFHFLSTE